MRAGIGVSATSMLASGVPPVGVLTTAVAGIDGLKCLGEIELATRWEC